MEDPKETNDADTFRRLDCHKTDRSLQVRTPYGLWTPPRPGFLATCIYRNYRYHVLQADGMSVSSSNLFNLAMFQEEASLSSSLEILQ